MGEGKRACFLFTFNGRDQNEGVLSFFPEETEVETRRRHETRYRLLTLLRSKERGAGADKRKVYERENTAEDTD